MCLTSRTAVRRALISLAMRACLAARRCPGGRAALYRAAARTASIADWVAVRAEDVVLILEDES